MRMRGITRDIERGKWGCPRAGRGIEAMMQLDTIEWDEEKNEINFFLQPERDCRISLFERFLTFGVIDNFL
jgi:hypothetical protein